MQTDLNKRIFLRNGLVILAAPAIVRAASLMPIRGLVLLTQDVTYYVSSDFDASDSNDGSIARPFRTFQRAMNFIENLDIGGHRVVINASGAFENVNIDLKHKTAIEVDRGNLLMMSNGNIRNPDPRAAVFTVKQFASVYADKRSK